MNAELKLKIEEITAQSLEKQSLLEEKILTAIEANGNFYFFISNKKPFC